MAHASVNPRPKTHQAVSTFRIVDIKTQCSLAPLLTRDIVKLTLIMNAENLQPGEAILFINRQYSNSAILFVRRDPSTGESVPWLDKGPTSQDAPHDQHIINLRCLLGQAATKKIIATFKMAVQNATVAKEVKAGRRQWTKKPSSDCSRTMRVVFAGKAKIVT